MSRQEILKRGKDNKLSKTAIDRALKALVETEQVDRKPEGREAFFTLKKPFSPSSCTIEDDNGLSDGPDVLTLPMAEVENLEDVTI